MWLIWMLERKNTSTRDHNKELRNVFSRSPLLARLYLIHGHDIGMNLRTVISNLKNKDWSGIKKLNLLLDVGVCSPDSAVQSCVSKSGGSHIQQNLVMQCAVRGLVPNRLIHEAQFLMAKGYRNYRWSYFYLRGWKTFLYYFPKLTEAGWIVEYVAKNFHNPRSHIDYMGFTINERISRWQSLDDNIITTYPVAVDLTTMTCRPLGNN